MRKIGTLLLVSILLSGCATMPAHLAKQPNPKIVNQPYDIVWEKTINLFYANNFMIEKQDKANGFIQSSWIQAGGVAGGYFSRMMGGETLMLRLTANMRQIEASATRVYVTCESAYQNTFGGMQPYQRAEKLEKQFLAALGD
ncbi:MAG: hypothetical protein P9L90_07080 [Candidatus Aadella gelida]|nr:hypothetical protein [Candidatus Aadella gelida]